jgi:cyclohexyl-isocyanide hydratase
MTRRTVIQGAASAALAVEQSKADKTPPLQIGMLVFPRLTQLDLTGPFEVFSRVSNSKVHLIWKTGDVVESDSGLALTPTMTFSDCPQLDVIMVPGGPGQIALMDDEVTLDFLRRQAKGSKWITSVCTGSLVLGAAGLLKGYKSACHWMSRDQLAELGAEPVNQRFVVDRNHASGGGVTAGIDFALKLASILRSDDEAKAIQLQLEYNPAPPFDAGSPEKAPEVAALLRKRSEPMLKLRREATARAKARLG